MSVRHETQGGIARITIDRPEARNALDPPTLKALGEALDAAAEDREVRVVILTGAGDKVFVSGADINDLKARTRVQGLEARLQSFFTRLERHPRVTIAAINGFALGGGCELALCCDLRIAAEGARLGFPETGLGILPGAGGTQRLPRVVGLGRAKELILTGDLIDAREAERIGLVNKVVPSAELAAAAGALAERILTRGPLATRLAKQALDFTAEAPRSAGLAFEALAQTVLYETRDKLEGTSAFLEKRKPRFTGE